MRPQKEHSLSYQCQAHCHLLHGAQGSGMPPAARRLGCTRDPAHWLQACSAAKVQAIARFRACSMPCPFAPDKLVLLLHLKQLES